MDWLPLVDPLARAVRISVYIHMVQISLPPLARSAHNPSRRESRDWRPAETRILRACITLELQGSLRSGWGAAEAVAGLLRAYGVATSMARMGRLTPRGLRT